MKRHSVNVIRCLVLLLIAFVFLLEGSIISYQLVCLMFFWAGYSLFDYDG